MKSKTKVECAFNITKNAFDSKKMVFRRGVKKLTDRVDNMSNIWSGDGQILERSNKRSIKSRI